MAEAQNPSISDQKKNADFLNMQCKSFSGINQKKYERTASANHVVNVDVRAQVGIGHHL
jgi:hypothetical protein